MKTSGKRISRCQKLSEIEIAATAKSIMAVAHAATREISPTGSAFKSSVADGISNMLDQGFSVMRNVAYPVIERFLDSAPAVMAANANWFKHVSQPRAGESSQSANVSAFRLEFLRGQKGPASAFRTPRVRFQRAHCRKNPPAAQAVGACREGTVID
jgi:hypothetical protein